ncbi:hypothetical protein HPB47_025512 [Ixodes persulcatus]|uniref:Uncharacterized protein n=1 Tax=Ixodes persulcatus TaxID=34615 RepID=A0AC60Q1E4_IXOPE|nr:hypothetical protein HPB47_025512 [Ixodes persulcatus]
MAAAAVVERSRVMLNLDKQKEPPLLKNPAALEESIDNEEDIQTKVQNILEVGQQLSKEGKAKELGSLIKSTRPFLNLISKAKAAKLVRALVDMFLDMEAATGMEVELCKECIDWAQQEKRTFLRQSLEVVGIDWDSVALSRTGSTLLKELKKLDDKNLLVEVQLLESKTYHALSNLPKARAALTSARTTANAIYCPPKLQAALDLQSGVLHAADERDFKTAFSYFYEAFECYDSIDHPKALIALKYMLLSKIMLNLPEEVQSLVVGKLALRHAGPQLEAMKSVARASHRRSLADFEQASPYALRFTSPQALKEYHKELVEDPIIQAHLDTLYDTMLEQNLCRIVEPYSRVQVDHIASTIKLPMEKVEKKLSQMILDKKFNGILDQGSGVLVIFEKTSVDKTFEAALETIQSMGRVVDSLYHKAKKLS